jgi:hypothetical protein
MLAYLPTTCRATVATIPLLTSQKKYKQKTNSLHWSVGCTNETKFECHSSASRKAKRVFPYICPHKHLVYTSPTKQTHLLLLLCLFLDLSFWFVVDSRTAHYTTCSIDPRQFSTSDTCGECDSQLLVVYRSLSL